jgi:hypothetical protein
MWAKHMKLKMSHKACIYHYLTSCDLFLVCNEPFFFFIILKLVTY